MKPKTTEWYEMKMMQYGVLTMLRVLKFLENDSQYEECAKIKSILDKYKFEGKPTQELIDDVVNSHQGIWNKEQVLEANRYYSEVTINDIYEKHVVIEQFPNNI